MKSQNSGFSLSQLAHHLTALSRERIDITALSVGGAVARGASSLVFWGIVALLAFFLFLALNIALGFALASWSESSPALGFLYLAAGYLVLILLVVLIRPWITKGVRDVVARKALAETKRINLRLDLIPYLRRQKYNSPARSVRNGGSYLVLEQTRYQTLLLQDDMFPQVVRGMTYLRDHRREIISDYVRDEALYCVASIPVLGNLLERLGYKAPEHSHLFSKRPHEQDKQPKGKLAKYVPYMLMAWDFLSPTLFGILAGQAQGLLLRLFSGKLAKGRHSSRRRY